MPSYALNYPYPHTPTPRPSGLGRRTAAVMRRLADLGRTRAYLWHASGQSPHASCSSAFRILLRSCVGVQPPRVCSSVRAPRR